MKRYYRLLLLFFLCSCSTHEYKVCQFETEDPELKMYHDILTELIEQHFYNGYLYKVDEKLDERFTGPMIDFEDTADFRNELIRLQNKIFNDTSKFATICYHQTLRYGPWEYLGIKDIDFPTNAELDTAKHWSDKKDFLTSFSPGWEAVADTIAKPQTKYTGESFKLCTAKVISCNHHSESDIGAVSFSRVFLNDEKNKGLLYYEFTCVGNCGMGEIILIHYINQRWVIKDTLQLWIS